MNDEDLGLGWAVFNEIQWSLRGEPLALFLRDDPFNYPWFPR